jgi:hypothetical protein
VLIASRLGVEHAELMTRAELVLAIERLSAPQKPRLARSGSWFDLARQLIASLVEEGLNMPDAAALIRGEAKLNEPPRPQPPVATVTLAKIYAAQGHVGRALSVLDEVLRSEPDHDPARELRDKLKLEQGTKSAPGASDATSDRGSARSSTQESHALVDEAPSDLLLVVSIRGGEPMLVWELGRETETSRIAGAAIQIRWAAFTPDWSGPGRQVIQISVDKASGVVPLNTNGDVRLLRACLGREERGEFVPLFNGPVVSVDDDNDSRVAFSLRYLPRKQLQVEPLVRRALRYAAH